jgi:hypothetical protein
MERSARRATQALASNCNPDALELLEELDDER